MKKNGRRVLGLLLLLIMMFTLVPSPNIFALEDEEESAAAASEATLEEQMVDIANEILEDINGEDQEEPEPDTEPVIEADPAEEEALVTEEETSEEETPEGDHAENEDSEESLPEADPEEESENEPEATDEVANTVLPEDSEEDEEPKEVTESEDETVSEEEPEEDEEEEELLEETEDEEYDVPYTAEAANFEVTAVTTNKAFDVPVSLVASVIPEDDSAFKEAEDALTESGKQYDGMLALDIHFEDENKNEVEPNRPVSISFKVKKAAIEEVTDDTTLIVPETVEVNHITSDESGETVAETVADFADNTDGNVAVSTSYTSDGESVEQIDASFEVDGFSTFVITWGEGTPPQYSATIHWGFDEGGVFKDLETPTTIDQTTSSVDLEIILDAEKYYFIGADYRLSEYAEEFENLKSTVLHKEDGVWKISLEDSGTVEVANGSHIYVHYAPYGEGHPYNPPNPPGADVLAPDTEKTVTDNEDGTYTIRLDIEGKSDHSIKVTAANVIVIMDITQSMTNSMGSQSRMAAAKQAMRTLISTLEPSKNTIYFRAINFGDNSQPYDYNSTSVGKRGVNWTTDETAMLAYVNGLSDNPNDFGTCWQAGLRGGYNIVTSEVPANDNLKNNATYVVFVTDGNPNCYSANNDGTGTWTGASGPGYNATAYNRAAYWANLLGPACEFYGVYCGASTDSGLGYLRSLIAAANGNDSNFINGTSESAIESAFAGIAQTIVNNLGAGGVTVDDGIPTLSNVSANVSAGEAGAFKYYITPLNGEETEWVKGATGEDDPGAPGATYSNTNGVTWDLGEAGELQNGWIYSLEFTVWPSQAAYDLIADLNNGIKKWDDLTDEQKASVDGNKDDGYTLKTNTHLYTNFTDLKGNTYQTVNDATPKAMNLPTETISVEKIWHNFLDSRTDLDIDGLQLVLSRDGEDYLEFDVDADNNWKVDNIYISCGQIVDGVVKEKGHDYYVTEKAKETIDKTEYWEVNSPYYHPMVVNGEMKLFIRDDDASSPAFEVNGHKYVEEESTSQSLTAINERVSWINLKKVVEGEGAPDDALFNYSITITEPTAEGEQPKNIFFSVFGDSSYMPGVTTSATEWLEESTGRTYYYVASGTPFTLSIKAGWSVRFLNIATDSTYSFTEIEAELPDGFAFDSAESVETLFAAKNVPETGYPKSTEFSKSTVTGKVNQTNTDYTVTYTNKYELIDIDVTKEWNDGNNQDNIRPSSVEVVLKGVGDTVYKKTLKGTTESKPSGSGVRSYERVAWTATFVDLPKYVAGEEVDYTADETKTDVITGEDGPGTYKYEVTGTIEDGFKVKNTHTPEVISVSVEKVWADNNDSAKKRPTSIQVQLKAGNDNQGDPVTLNEANEWKYTWPNLPKNAGGQEISYSVDETSIPDGYKKTVAGDVSTGFTITNEYVTVSVKATKVWNDADNQDGKREDVTFNLLAGDTVVQSETISKTATGSALTVTWSDLPAYKNGELINYSVEEANVVDGKITMSGVKYTVTVQKGDDGYTITNSYTPAKIDISVTKIWDDENDHDGKRPESLTLTLNNVPKGVTVPDPTITKSEDGNKWTYTWTGLPKYSGGEEIQYKVSEEEDDVPEGYTVTGSPAVNGGEIKNTHKPEEVEVIVQKVWEDNNSPSRPKTITIHLLADGEDTEKKVVLDGTADETGETAEWKATFSKLPKFKKDENGTVSTIKYTVKEDEVKGYKTTYDPPVDDTTEPVSGGEAQPDNGDDTPVDPEDEVVSGGDANDAPSKEETTVETINITVTNTLTLIDIEIEKTVLNLYDADEDDDNGANATFVFEITVQGKNEDKPRYHSFVGIVFDEKAGTQSILVSGIPYEKGDTVTVKEVYTAGHILTDSKGDWVIEDVSYKASFTNNFSDIPYSSGIVNRGLHEGNELVIVQEEQQEEEQFR